jgi:PAS domain S-box-containing protein
VRDEDAAIAEAEALIAAVRAGGIDGFVVGQAEPDLRVLLLSDSFARYRDLVEHMEQGAVTATRSGLLLYVNEAFARLLELPASEIAGTPLPRRVVAADRPVVARLLAASAGESAQIRLVPRGGTHVTIRLAVVATGDDVVTLIATTVASATASEAELTLAAIREGRVDAFVVGDQEIRLLDGAQAPYRALVDRMRQGAVTLAPTGEIVFANDRFATLVGQPAHQLVGRRLAIWVAERDRSAFDALCQAKQDATAELSLRQSSGARVAVHVAASPLGDLRQLMFSDLTERRRHEAFDGSTRRFLEMFGHGLAAMLEPMRQATATLAAFPHLGETERAAVRTMEVTAGRLAALVAELKSINTE